MRSPFNNNDKKMVREDHCSKKTKVLFILKQRTAHYGNTSSYGLMVSCQMVSECLRNENIDSKIVTVIDSNSIDREVFNYKPTHVVLEAIWCPPYKLAQLLNLYPKIKWDVRLHSKFPFLAQEKMALEWLNQYKNLIVKFKNLTISANNRDFIDEINNTLGFNIRYTPNCYPVSGSIFPNTKKIGEILDIGCFGALRILKNHVQQAIAAIFVANCLNKKLRFHINDSSTFEKEGNPILNNLKHIFEDSGHQLVIHPWDGHDNFVALVQCMDLGMQMSFTESFNLTAADFVSNGIPLLGSSEIEFLSGIYQAKPANFKDIVEKLKFIINNKWLGLHIINTINLRKHTKQAVKDWLFFLKS